MGASTFEKINILALRVLILLSIRSLSSLMSLILSIISSVSLLFKYSATIFEKSWLTL